MNQDTFIFASRIGLLFCCVCIHFPSYAGRYAHVWGGKDTRSGIWQAKSYEVQHEGFQKIKSPEKCEQRSCITLHISCTYADYNNMEKKKFSASVLIERHPSHPKQPNPFRVPSYSPQANIWLNGQKFQANLVRSSLFVSFFYGVSYFWTVSFDAELFDIIPARQINFRMESEDQLLKVQALFDLSQELGVFKFMKSICSRPGKDNDTADKAPSSPINLKKLF